MRIFDTDSWQEIFNALSKNKWRTFFTAFGVFWGIFMLIIMLGSGKGLNNGVTQEMGDMATNSFFMWTQNTTMPYKGFKRGRHYNFDNDDTQAIIDNIPEVEYIAPRLQGWSSEGNSNVVRNERTGAFRIQGDYPDFYKIDPVDMVKGRFINEFDIRDKRKVAVIGQRVYNEMYEPDEDPIGTSMRINGVYFKIIGLFKSKKSGHQADNDNQQIFIPFTTLQKTYNYGNIVGWYSITVKGAPVSEVETQVKALMRQRHSIHPDDERAVGSFNLENQYKKMTTLFMGINGLIWIVGIGTLLAGVIGVSNIMLIVVKERTKEIGVQRAIGATPWMVISQIITESVILTTIAGYTGLVLGVAALEGVNLMIQQSGGESGMFLNPEVDFQKAMTALIVLIFSGMIAGLIPARRAVSIKPIDALRDE